MIIGQALDQPRVTMALDACLCTNEEVEAPPESWDVVCQDDALYNLWNAALEMKVNHYEQQQQTQHDHDHSHSHGDPCQHVQ